MRKRPLRIDGEIAYVPLTRGLEAVIDIADVPIASARNWTALPSGSTHYAVCMLWNDGRWSSARLHREIVGAGEGQLVDHIDGNGLNNRRSNLRVATRTENNRNAATRKDNTSGFKGVHWHKGDSRWEAQIRVNGKRIRLGSFSTPEAAHAAYCEAAAKYHGAFARPA